MNEFFTVFMDQIQIMLTSKSKNTNKQLVPVTLSTTSTNVTHMQAACPREGTLWLSIDWDSNAAAGQINHVIGEHLIGYYSVEGLQRENAVQGHASLSQTWALSTEGLETQNTTAQNLRMSTSIIGDWGNMQYKSAGKVSFTEDPRNATMAPVLRELINISKLSTCTMERAMSGGYAMSSLGHGFTTATVDTLPWQFWTSVAANITIHINEPDFLDTFLTAAADTRMVLPQWAKGDAAAINVLVMAHLGRQYRIHRAAATINNTGGDTANGFVYSTSTMYTDNLIATRHIRILKTWIDAAPVTVFAVACAVGGAGQAVTQANINNWYAINSGVGAVKAYNLIEKMASMEIFGKTDFLYAMATEAMLSDRKAVYDQVPAAVTLDLAKRVATPHLCTVKSIAEGQLYQFGMEKHNHIHEINLLTKFSRVQDAVHLRLDPVGIAVAEDAFVAMMWYYWQNCIQPVCSVAIQGLFTCPFTGVIARNELYTILSENIYHLTQLSGINEVGCEHAAFENGPIFHVLEEGVLGSYLSEEYFRQDIPPLEVLAAASVVDNIAVMSTKDIIMHEKMLTKADFGEASMTLMRFFHVAGTTSIRVLQGSVAILDMEVPSMELNVADSLTMVTRFKTVQVPVVLGSRIRRIFVFEFSGRNTGIMNSLTGQVEWAGLYDTLFGKQSLSKLNDPVFFKPLIEHTATGNFI